MRVVGIGGGTGLPVLLKGLKKVSGHSNSDASCPPLEIAAVVAVSDNGGSSGHLRQSFGIPAVGDLRNCLVALSDRDAMLPDLFQYRFPPCDGLHGHALGNLIVSALCLTSGSLGQAAEMAARLLGLRGSVLPVTEKPVALCAELNRGERVRGEAEIAAARQQIRKIWLEPESPPPSAGVLEAISHADVIVLGPGSLYTSILPNLLVEGVAAAVRSSPALKIFVCNLMTQPGETSGFTATSHLRAVEAYLGPGALDACVLNSSPLRPALLRKHLESGSEPVLWNRDEITQMGILAVSEALLEDLDLRVRHDPVKLAHSVLSVANTSDQTTGIVSLGAAGVA